MRIESLRETALNAVASSRALATARSFALMAGFAVLTAVLAQVSFYIPGVAAPVTLQTLGVLASGYLLGPRRGLASMMMYLALGASGLPVFAASAIYPQGIARLFGPTGGYLLAFPLATGLVGDIARREWTRSWLGRALAFLAGTIVIHACGIIWLSSLTAAPIGTLLAANLLPFAAVDLAKAGFLASLLGRRRY